MSYFHLTGHLYDYRWTALMPIGDATAHGCAAPPRGDAPPNVTSQVPPTCTRPGQRRLGVRAERRACRRRPARPVRPGLRLTVVEPGVLAVVRLRQLLPRS